MPDLLPVTLWSVKPQFSAEDEVGGHGLVCGKVSLPVGARDRSTHPLNSSTHHLKAFRDPRHTFTLHMNTFTPELGLMRLPYWEEHKGIQGLASASVFLAGSCDCGCVR